MIAGVVLAGGRARRMGGRDKPLLPLGTSTLLDMIVERLRPQVDALAINANGDPARFVRFGLPVIADGVADAGPLAGIAAALAWGARQGAAFVQTVPGDLPFFPRDLVRCLSPGPSWAASDGCLHPVVGLWPCSASDTLAAWLLQGRSRRVRDFGEAIGMRTVEFRAADRAFFNINTPADLAAAGEIGHQG